MILFTIPSPHSLFHAFFHQYYLDLGHVVIDLLYSEILGWPLLFTELLTEFKQLGIENEFVEYMSQQEEWI